MHYLIYVSAAARLLPEDELVRLLETSRARNVADGITGMLLYKDSSFMQLLEGDEDRVLETYARISADARHGGLIVLRQGAIAARYFPDWSMGFRSVNATDLAAIPGFAKLGHGSFTSPAVTEKPHIAITALKSFLASPR